MSDEIDLIIKLRDAGQLIADACAEYLQKMAPKEEPSLKEEPFNALPWKEGQGAEGSYEMVRDDGSDLFRHLKAILQQNKGRFSEKTWRAFYWLGQDGDVIFRRTKKKFSKPESKAEADVIATVKEKFPEDLRGLLSFEEQPDAIIIKPREFLGAERFTKIAAIVRGAGGTYISDKKNSQFEILKGK